MPRNAMLQGVCGLLIGISAGGCGQIGMTAAGIGGNVAVSHTLSGITYRTFTAPSSTVKIATLVALDRMDITVIATVMDGQMEILQASAAGRAIEIQLEPLSGNTTRMRVIAKSRGFLYDSATATEIILQTERVLGGDG